MHPGSKIALAILLIVVAKGLFSPPLPLTGVESFGEIVFIAVMPVIFSYIAGYVLWWLVFNPIRLLWQWYWKPWD